MANARVPNRDDEIHVFAYGSLIFEPELAASMLRRQPARLPGYRRAFNKLSLRRSTPREESFDAFAEVPSQFRQQGENLSLSLGTVIDPSAAIEGEVQIYPGEIEVELLSQLDAREGCDASRAPEENGYERAVVSLEVEDEVVAAKTYLTNPHPGCVFAIAGDIDDGMRAKILINATPREDCRVAGERARGLFYLEGTRESLWGAGIVDPALESLARALRDLPGPWVELVAPPRRCENPTS